eukprot:scaffold3731_cov149-Isochrysis_galbana.AAC.1
MTISPSTNCSAISASEPRARQRQRTRGARCGRAVLSAWRGNVWISEYLGTVECSQNTHVGRRAARSSAIIDSSDPLSDCSLRASSMLGVVLTRP